MRELAQLWSEFEARRLRETARWRYYFIQRLQADGFTVVENNARPPKAFAKAWKQWKDERDDQHWHTILTVADPLPDDDLDTLRLAGNEITRALRLRNVRWHIETAKADSLVVDQDRDLMKAGGRKRLFHLRDWLSTLNDLQTADQGQRDEGRPIHQRRYGVYERDTIASLFRLLGHEGTPEEQLMGFIDSFRESMSAFDVAARYGMVTSQEAMSKFKALGHYGNNARTVCGLCRWLLEYFGLKVKSGRRRLDGDLVTCYQIDAETLDYRLERARFAAARRGVIRNVYSSPQYTKVITSDSKQSNTTVHPKTSWAAAPKAFAERLAALGMPSQLRLPI